MNNFDNEQQAREAAALAFGRILRLGSRPTQPGDVAQYENARAVVIAACEYLGIDGTDTRHNYIKDVMP